MCPLSSTIISSLDHLVYGQTRWKWWHLGPLGQRRPKAMLPWQHKACWISPDSAQKWTSSLRQLAHRGQLKWPRSHTTELNDLYLSISLCNDWGMTMNNSVRMALHLASFESQWAGLHRSMSGLLTFLMGKRPLMTQRWYNIANFFAMCPISSFSSSVLFMIPWRFLGSNTALRVWTSFLAAPSLLRVLVRAFWHSESICPFNEWCISARVSG